MSIFRIAAFLLHMRREGPHRSGGRVIDLHIALLWRTRMHSLLFAALLVAAPDATETSAETEAGEHIQEEEEVICRRRLIPSERVGERFRRQEICMTREEWEAERLRRR
jgi:hypothetical protein